MEPAPGSTTATAGLAMTLLVSLSCVQPLDLTGRPCPCAIERGFVCCELSGRCVRPAELSSPVCRFSAPPPPDGAGVNADPVPIAAGDAAATAGGEMAVGRTGTPPPDAAAPPPVDAAVEVGSPAACVGEPRGVRALYWDDLGHAGLMTTAVAPAFSFDLSEGPPDPTLRGDSVWSSAFSTQLQPSVSGDYTFFVAADDGFDMWLDREQLLSWGLPYGSGGHTMAASVPLTAGRRYHILIRHFNESGGARVDLTWAPPGGSRQPIPACELFLGPPRPANCPDPFNYGCYPENAPFCTCDDTGNGLDIRFFSDPAFSTLEHQDEVALITLDDAFDWLRRPSTRPALRETRFAIRWEGVLRPPFGETFTFFLLADGETVLHLGDQQVRVVPDPEGVMKEVTLTVPLEKRAAYPIRIDYLQRGAPETSKIQLAWRSPSMPKTEVAFCYLQGSAPGPVKPCRPGSRNP